MSEPNESQKQISEVNLEGIVVVDAGPGTGKTKTIVDRYCNIIDKGVPPSDMLLLTFTRNAAAEMEDRIRAMLEKKGKGDLSSGLRVGTFDSFCFSVVMESPEAVSRFFNFKENLTRSARISENETFNETYFDDFFDIFLMNYGDDYGDATILASQNYTHVYHTILKLMSRGIIPMKEGWLIVGEKRTNLCDAESLKRYLDIQNDELNEKGKSKLAIAVAEGKKKAELNSEEEKNVSDETIMEIVDDMSEDTLKLFHDAYYQYLRRAVIDDRLTFGVVSIFAFAILYSDKKVREKMSSKYLMVDEFQDTNLNQLAITLMLMKEPNLCVVGDWKQGIYGFRYVSIENLIYFKERSNRLIKWLNMDEDRITFDADSTVSIPLKKNYRSSQTVIDCAYRALYLKATQDEIIDPNLSEKITKIEADRTDIGEFTAIEYAQAPDKEEAVAEVIRRVMNYVGSGKYKICDKEVRRNPKFRDIAVLCRTGATARAVFKAAKEANIPAFLQGDVDIMGSREGKLLLAWLRYVNNEYDLRGLTAIMADQDYPLCEMRAMLKPAKEEGSEEDDQKRYENMVVPDDIKNLRARLKKMKRITNMMSAIFDYYKLNNDITQTLIAKISSAHRVSLLTVSDIIRMIEKDIEDNTPYPVDSSLDGAGITIQTVHKSKGLEYPIVIIADLNAGSFPSTQGDKSKYLFSENAGIRCKDKIYRAEDITAIIKSWTTYTLAKLEPKEYDEERRLLFVAISRAKQYVTMVAGNPSKFFEGIKGTSGTKCLDDSVMNFEIGTETSTLSDRPVVAPFEKRRKNVAVHDILEFDADGTSPPEGSDEFCGKGMEYGINVHIAAELIARGIEPKKDYPECAEIRKILKSLDGATLIPEKECSLPFNDLNASLRGIIDLLVIYPDRIEIHDYKTDVERVFEKEYMIQLSVYAHAASEYYGKPAKCVIDYVSRCEKFEFEPLDKQIIRERLAKFLK